VRTAMIALSAAALIAAVPVVSAQSSTPGQHHKLSRKHPPGVSAYAPWHETKARGSKNSYPGTFGYAPAEPRDQATEMSRQAGGGGGGGGSGM
jgi:hypothetical protein